MAKEGKVPLSLAEIVRNMENRKRRTISSFLDPKQRVIIPKRYDGHWRDTFLLSSTALGYDGTHAWIGNVNIFRDFLANGRGIFRWTSDITFSTRLEQPSQQCILEYLRDKEPSIAKQNFRLRENQGRPKLDVPNMRPSCDSLSALYENIKEPIFSFLVLSACFEKKYGQIFRLHSYGTVRDGILGVSQESFRVAGSLTSTGC